MRSRDPQPFASPLDELPVELPLVPLLLPPQLVPPDEPPEDEPPEDELLEDELLEDELLEPLEELLELAGELAAPPEELVELLVPPPGPDAPQPLELLELVPPGFVHTPCVGSKLCPLVQSKSLSQRAWHDPWAQRQVDGQSESCSQGPGAEGVEV